MSSAYGRIPKPQGTSDLSTILPIKKVLRNGIEGYIQQVDPNNKPLVDYLHSRFNKEIEDRNGIEGYIQQVDPNNKPLVDYLHSRFNKEIEDGSTYPQENTLNEQEFRDYFLG
ncbi:hypothetical protein RMCBS344292_10479 [Rhizopus microsporus]|nr:hypothetical protein RMCBS344292_10479 [Rhizopus microsporus]